MMNFSDALENLKLGYKVSRSGWNGKGMWIQLKKPNGYFGTEEMTLPYIFMKTVTDDTVPWLASQTDILADDWDVVD